MEMRWCSCEDLYSVDFFLEEISLGYKLEAISLSYVAIVKWAIDTYKALYILFKGESYYLIHFLSTT